MSYYHFIDVVLITIIASITAKILYESAPPRHSEYIEQAILVIVQRSIVYRYLDFSM